MTKRKTKKGQILNKILYTKNTENKRVNNTNSTSNWGCTHVV